jgi:hypothetical protein
MEMAKFILDPNPENIVDVVNLIRSAPFDKNEELHSDIDVLFDSDQGVYDILNECRYDSEYECNMSTFISAMTMYLLYNNDDEYSRMILYQCIRSFPSYFRDTIYVDACEARYVKPTRRIEYMIYVSVQCVVKMNPSMTYNDVERIAVLNNPQISELWEMSYSSDTEDEIE